MRIENKSKELKLEFFSSLYESALMASSTMYSSLEKYMKQYKGSSEIDGSDESAITVRNITYEIVESQVSSDIPSPKVDAPSYSIKHSRAAESIERLCRSLRARLPFDKLNDIDERYTYIYGGSVWYIDWESSLQRGDGQGDVSVYCLSPMSFVPQPGILEVDDMEYCFLTFTTTRGELVRKWGISYDEATLAECECEYDGCSADIDSVKMVVCFYRDEDGEVGRYVFSGDVVLSDMPRYYMRKGEVCKACGRPIGECDHGAGYKSREIRYESLEEDIVLSDGEVIPKETIKLKSGEPVKEKTLIPYYVPRDFPIVIRKNTTLEGSLLGGSDPEYIRPEQQAINKVESRILKKLLRAGITPIVPEDANITLNNSVFGQIIRMKPGESAAQYGKVDTTPDISQDIAEAERLYDHAKRVIGITDAYQGNDFFQGESGVARQLRISQASGRLESKKKMKHTAYAAIDKLIFKLYLAFADEPRQLSYKDDYGRIHYEQFSRYEFVRFDKNTAEYFFDDDYLFTVDLNGGAEYQREALWQRNLDNLRAGTLGDPSSPVTLLRYWQCQERAHYPYARENVEYFSRECEAGGGFSDVAKDTVAQINS